MILNSNEIILKEILPRKSFFFSLTEKLRILISFGYLIFVVFFAVVTFKTIVFLFTVPLLVAAFYNSFLRWIPVFYHLKNNYYLITNQRIIIASRSKKEIIRYRKLEEIDQVHADMNDRFFGNIIFGKPEGVVDNSSGYLGGNRGILTFKNDRYAFLSIENIDEIIVLINELGLKVNKTFY